MKYKLIIFDWDGTLMDSRGRIVASLQAMARELGLSVPDDARASDIIGLSLRPAFEKLFGTISQVQYDAMVASYRTQFVHTSDIPTPLFPGVHELLRTLSGSCQLAVATGKARRGLNRAFAQTGTGEYFRLHRTADEAESKPSPDMLEQLLELAQVQPDEALMVGDTSYDLAMAEALDMDRVGVSYGAHPAERLLVHQPLAVIDRPLALLTLPTLSGQRVVPG